MATHASAEKAARQAIRRQLRNVQTLSHCKTVIKKVRTQLQQKFKTPEEATKLLLPLLDNAEKTLMKAASKRILKPETAARYISRLSRAVHQVTAPKRA